MYPVERKHLKRMCPPTNGIHRKGDRSDVRPAVISPHQIWTNLELFLNCVRFLQGTLYLNMHGFEERASIAQLHDDSMGVIVAQKCCRHCFKVWPSSRADVLEAYTEYCAQALRKYELYDFEDLMNTTFALVPAGASPGTHRLPEVRNLTGISKYMPGTV